MGSRVLLQGPAKSGKTTVAERLAALLRPSDVEVEGFVTREIRVGDRRVGFAVRDFAGWEVTIAHQDFDSPIRVGKYGVDVPAFERIALPALYRALTSGGVVLVDEVARMELASEAFTRVFGRVVDRVPRLVATVHVHAHPVTDALLRRPDVQVVQVTPELRDGLPVVLAARLQAG